MIFKSFISTACTSIFSMFFYVSNVSATTYDVSGLFSAYDPSSTLIAAQSNTPITGEYNDATDIMSLDAVEPFFGIYWNADGNIITTPGTYDVDTIQGDLITGIEVGEGQWFADFLYDYGGTFDVDVVHVWDVTYNLDGTIELISTDVISDIFPTGSGAPGHPVYDGATIGFTYSFDLLLTPTTVPVPAAVWLFGSGLIGLIGVARRTKS